MRLAARAACRPELEEALTRTNLPAQGVVFWPVGCGDSTTVVIDDRHVMQVDIRDMKQADDADAVVAAVIDRLEETLPRTDDDEPYLAVFALTHGDSDHCCGFGDLLDSSILIGELWATPRLWRETATDEEMCEDAKRFHAEADRRVQATLDHIAAGRDVPSGDRIRVIGYDEDFEELNLAYSALPEECLSFPGDAIETIDGDDVSEHFSAFVHAPFKDDCAGERNETSLALHILLRNPEHTGSGGILLFGDLSYPTIKKMFTYSKSRRPERLAWDVMLAAHHCSKKVMYAPGDDGTEERKQDILDMFEEAAGTLGYVVASSMPFRDADNTGDNPPHLLARDAYDDIAPSGVVCTGEYPTAEAPRPIVFGLEPDVGLELLDVDTGVEEKAASASASSRLLVALGATAVAALAARAARTRNARQASQSGLDASRAAVRDARGGEAEPNQAVGFGSQLP
jgi:hypothetical protein